MGSEGFEGIQHDIFRITQRALKQTEKEFCIKLSQKGINLEITKFNFALKEKFVDNSTKYKTLN